MKPGAKIEVLLYSVELTGDKKENENFGIFQNYLMQSGSVLLREYIKASTEPSSHSRYGVHYVFRSFSTCVIKRAGHFGHWSGTPLLVNRTCYAPTAAHVSEHSLRSRISMAHRTFRPPCHWATAIVGLLRAPHIQLRQPRARRLSLFCQGRDPVW